MHVFVVKPKLPTVLGDREFYDLQDTDLTLAFRVDTVHVFPGLIDVDRFNDALSRTLSLYPLAAGNIQKPLTEHAPWKVLLTNSGVPVTVVESNATQIFESNTIIQIPLKFIQVVNNMNILKGIGDEPLLKVTITSFTSLGHTSIAFSSIHCIGDGFAVLMFIRLLSQNYQGLDPLDPPPSYEHFSNLSDAAYHLDIPVLENMYPAELDPLPWNDTTKAVLVALLAHSISQADPSMPPIHRILTVVNHRGMFAPNFASCNVLAWAYSEPPTIKTTDSVLQTVVALAKQIRYSVLRLRDPEYLNANIRRCGFLYREAASREMSQDFSPPLGQMAVNSTWRFDWNSAHFGYPGRTKFYHNVLPVSRFIEIFTPNPVLLPDGSWTDPIGDAEVAFYLNKDVKERFEKILQMNARDLGCLAK